MNGVNGPGEFTNSLGGNFTKIVVTADNLPSGDGWSAGTWNGSASSVSFTGNIESWGSELSIVCTLETPAAEETVTLNHSANNTWAIAEMPGYDVELEVEYFDITVPTANTADIYAGSTTPLINAGSTTEEGATMKYLVTATNEQPASTDGFSADVPTAQAITAPGTYYVWYYLDLDSGDDSDISALAVEVTVEKAAITLDETADNSSALTDWNNHEATVTVKRTLQTGGWNTFCLPFSMTLAEFKTAIGDDQVQVKELASSSLTGETLTLNFADAQSIVAGTPYLVQVTDAVANPTFDGVIISQTAQTKETTYADFVPVFGPTNLEGGNKNILFVIGGNTLTYPTASGNINGFRAYFYLHDAPTARAFAMSFDDAAGIETIDHSPLNIDHSVYDLQGRRMANGQSSTVDGQSLKKGVYIVNGKKTVIK